MRAVALLVAARAAQLAAEPAGRPPALLSAQSEARVDARARAAAEIRELATSGGDYPCPGSGKMLEVCDWYMSFTKENPEPPRALAGDLFGGTPQWHGPDPEIVTACDSNRNTICVMKSPLCEAHQSHC